MGVMIEPFIEKRKLPKYRKTQFNRAFYKEFIESYDELTTWPKDLREALKSEVAFSSLSPVKEIQSRNKNTIKTVFKRVTDGKQFESVLMRHKDGRNTVCVSCMIGCPVGCVFCATGRMGYQGNLTSTEIVDQVLYYARILKKEKQGITNVVFMGMGEPLLNLPAVLEAIHILTDPERFGMSQRRLTISTSGITPGLHQLIASGYKGRLALSLHASDQTLRESLIPIAEKYLLSGVLNELKTFSDETNKRVSYEYILISGVNDSPNDARALITLLGTRLTHVNLIPYNPVEGVPLKRSTPDSIRVFSEILTKSGLQHTVRITMGDDIKAACGQLAGSNH